MSPDPENEYFSDGITEEIINALTKVKGLRVTSRTSTFMFKQKNEDIRKIGHQLNVTSVLEGSVRKFKDRVRITAQLINTADGYHQWSEVYDRDLEDIFFIQDEISKTIAKKLSDDLMAAAGEDSLVPSHTADVEAYNLFLKGLFHWNKWTASDVHTAIKFFAESSSKDPHFALPYSALSNSYIFLGAYGFMGTKMSYPKARAYAQKALQLDPNLGEAYNSYALIKLFFDWDWGGSYEAFQNALRLKPGSGLVHQSYTYYMMAMGRIDEALSEIETARMLDPLSIVINNVLAEVYFYAERYDDALKQLDRTLELDPGFRGAIWNRGIMNLFNGNHETAIEIFEELTRLEDPKSIAPLGYAYAVSGNKEKAVQCIEALNEVQKNNPEISINMDYAIIYRGLNDKEKMYCHLEKAYEEKAVGVIFLKSHPQWKKLSGDKNYEELLKKIGF
jgi:TolB-like protein/Flp pilus assembly protein TadD